MKTIATMILLFCIGMLAADDITLVNKEVLTGTINGYERYYVYMKTTNGNDVKVDKRDIESMKTDVITQQSILTDKTSMPFNHLKYRKYDMLVEKTMTNNQVQFVEMTEYKMKERTVEKQLDAINHNVKMIWVSQWAMYGLGIITSAILINQIK